MRNGKNKKIININGLNPINIPEPTENSRYNKKKNESSTGIKSVNKIMLGLENNGKWSLRKKKN